MTTYTPPLHDIQFLLRDVFAAEQLAALPGCEEATPDMVEAILEEAGRLCSDVFHPLNQSGDAEGCVFADGAVKTPKGFAEAYQTFTQGGWMGLSCAKQWGGQGLPVLLNVLLDEMVCSANLSLGMYPGLSHGAYNALAKHAAPDLQQTYLPKLVSGVWSGTMCLTEPHCGTDLGLISTKATPQQDGSFQLTGTKIFISAGEHDLTENILHLVLAKLPDAPAGVRGISLFLVPKFLPQADGTPGARNKVFCTGIEHKMGIKGSATCVLSFEGATGWLVGAPHKGMKAMFTMMNEARLLVGLQGLGIAETAYQNALAYAKTRLQGRGLKGAQYPEKPADPIMVHPDVRRMLLEMKAVTEGCRALAVWVGMELDIESKHADATRRQQAADVVALMTPIIKAFLTDHGFNAANLAVQIFGGHGYIRDYGMEQLVRDARIAQIYEGTNGIQALDLVGRKMPEHFGRLLRPFFHPVADFIANHKKDASLEAFLPSFAKIFQRFQQITLLVAVKGAGNPEEAAAAATDYLRCFALVALGYMWLLMAKAAAKKAETSGESDFYTAKHHTAAFFFAKILPEANARMLNIQAGAKTLLMPAELF